MNSTTFRLAASLLLLSPCLISAQETKTHPKDPRVQDRTSTLEGYVELRQLVTTAPPKLYGAAEVQPQAGYVGIHLDPPTAGSNYWKIGGVGIESPAAKAGLKKGDAVVKIGDQPVVDARLIADYLRSRNAGEKLSVEIERNGNKQEVVVVVEATSRPLVSGPAPTIGITTSETYEGVKVDRVQPASPAESGGMKTGDIIVKIDDTLINGPEVYSALIASRKVGDQLQVIVKRANEELKLTLKTAAQGTGGGGRGGGGGNQRWDERSATTFKRNVYRLAIVPIEYPDVKHNPRFALTDWEEMLFSSGTYVGSSPSGQTVYGSMNDFYREQSYGKLRVEGLAFQWIQVSKPRTEYSINSSNRNAVLTEALDKLLARDGEQALDGFDGIFFIYAGGTPPNTNRGGIYWPHRSNQFYKGKHGPILSARRTAGVPVVTRLPITAS